MKNGRIKARKLEEIQHSNDQNSSKREKKTPKNIKKIFLSQKICFHRLTHKRGGGGDPHQGTLSSKIGRQSKKFPERVSRRKKKEHIIYKGSKIRMVIGLLIVMPEARN